MASTPSSAPTSPLSRQLLRSVTSSPSSLCVALYRPAAPPTISLASVPRRVDAATAASSQQLRAVRRGGGAPPPPKGGPGEPKQGGGGKVHAAAPLAVTARVVMRGRRPSPRPPSSPPPEGSGGKVHAAPVMAMAHVLMRGPPEPSHTAEGAGGRGGSVHAATS